MADYSEDRRYSENLGPSGRKIVTDLLGKDTYRRRDRVNTFAPSISEGAGAELMLIRSTNTPADIIKRYRGERKGDVSLKPSLTKGRSVTGKRR